ncbi:MAG: hypothetical protein ACLGH0_07130 [Thermoanaerobaculia bacterium]
MIAPAVAAGPVLSFERSNVVVSGLAAGDQALVVGVAHEPVAYKVHTVLRGEIVAGSSDGSARYDFTRALPPKSVWAGIDLRSGAVTIASPRPEFLSVTREKLNPGQLRRVTRAHSHALFVLIRPTVGAWHAIVHDSDIADADGKGDKHVSLDLARMQPYGASPAVPDEITAEDVLLVFEPFSLHVTELRRE